jgi:hypothetical protein
MANEKPSGPSTAAERNAQSVTKEVMASQSIDRKAEGITFDFEPDPTDPTEPTPLDPDKPDFDPDDALRRREEDKQKPQQQERKSMRDRWTDLKEKGATISKRAVELKTEFNEKHPYASKAVGIGFRIASKTNVYFRGASYAYDGYKTLREFVELAENFKKNEELLQAAKTAKKAFHEIETAAKEKDIQNLQKELARETRKGKLDIAHNVGDVRNSNQERIDEIHGRIHDATHHPPKLEAVLSQKAALTTPEATTRFAQRSAFKASEYEKQMMTGGAEGKYHWLLQEAKKELGEGYFNIETHPQRALMFDRFAAEHLYVSGFSKTEVHNALCQSGMCSFTLQQHPGITVSGVRTNQRMYETELLEHTINVQSRNIDKIKEKVVYFQIENKNILDGAKITKDEFTKYQELQTKFQIYRSETINKLYNDFTNVHQRYVMQKGQGDFSKTQQQFLINYGQEAMRGAKPDIPEIAYKLHVAGHNDKEIIETVTHYHPEYNGSFEKSKELLEKIKDSIEKNPVRQQEFKNINTFKTENGLSAEKRIDRLPFNEQPREPIQPAKSYQDYNNTGHTTMTPSKTQDREIER